MGVAGPPLEPPMPTSTTRSISSSAPNGRSAATRARRVKAALAEDLDQQLRGAVGNPVRFVKPRGAVDHDDSMRATCDT